MESQDRENEEKRVEKKEKSILIMCEFCNVDSIFSQSEWEAWVEKFGKVCRHCLKPM